MRKSILKKVSAVIATAALTVAMTTSAFAADRWASYFGQNMGWYEGAIGELTSQSDTGWVAKMDMIGWGGVWGAQVKDENLSLKAGVEYSLSFTMTTKDVDKWVFVKVANDKDDLLYGDWIQLKVGKKTAYNKNFTLKEDATKIVFGIGGEFSDRVDEEEMYKLTSAKPYDEDSAYATTITCAKFSLKEAGAASVKPDPGKKKKVDGGNTPSETTASGARTTPSTNPGTTAPVQTGDAAPIACAAVAIAAAAVVVVFSRKKEEA
ncbi:MAG: hypothetical protein E7254_00445 [Lachnospiraceae bacterium]|nr:hypothetical protein [Lachnospiraceae bacterium]